MHYLHTFITLRHAVKSIIISFYEVIFEHDIAGFVSLRWFYKGYTKEILLKKISSLQLQKIWNLFDNKRIKFSKWNKQFLFPFCRYQNIHIIFVFVQIGNWQVLNYSVKIIRFHTTYTNMKGKKIKVNQNAPIYKIWIVYVDDNVNLYITTLKVYYI